MVTSSEDEWQLLGEQTSMELDSVWIHIGHFVFEIKMVFLEDGPLCWQSTEGIEAM